MDGAKPWRSFQTLDSTCCFGVCDVCVNVHVHVAECELRASVALFVKGSEYVGVALEFSFLNKSIPQLSVVCLSFTFVCACRSGR